MQWQVVSVHSCPVSHLVFLQEAPALLLNGDVTINVVNVVKIRSTIGLLEFGCPVLLLAKV